MPYNKLQHFTQGSLTEGRKNGIIRQECPIQVGNVYSLHYNNSSRSTDFKCRSKNFSVILATIGSLKLPCPSPMTV